MVPIHHYPLVLYINLILVQASFRKVKPLRRVGSAKTLPKVKPRPMKLSFETMLNNSKKKIGDSKIK